MNTINIHSSVLKQNNVIELVPTTIRNITSFFSTFYLLVFFPMLVSGIVFYSIFDLRGFGMLIASAVTLALLVNIYFLYIKFKTSVNQINLSIEFNELILLQNGQVLNRIPLHEIEVSQLQWGDIKTIPVIQISGNEFPRLRIGYIRSSRDWSELRTTKELIDFRVNTEKDWNQLLALLTQEDHISNELSSTIKL